MEQHCSRSIALGRILLLLLGCCSGIVNARIIRSSSSSSSWGVPTTSSNGGFMPRSRSDDDLNLELPLESFRTFVGQVGKQIMSTAQKQVVMQRLITKHNPLTTTRTTTAIKSMLQKDYNKLIEKLPKFRINSLTREMVRRRAERIESLMTNLEGRMQQQPTPEQFLLFQGQIMDYPIRLFGEMMKKKKHNNGYSARRRSSSSSSTTTTATAELANCFERAYLDNNNNNGEIHVGNLLLACEQLESTMRRIGLAQCANTMAGNIARIKTVYHQLPESCRDSMPALLQYEINSNKVQQINNQHKPNNNKIKIPDQSATCGFLWLGRSLSYQQHFFRYLLEHDDCTLYQAATVAYEHDMKHHLSWPLQKFVQAAMATTLQRNEKFQRNQLLAQMGGFSSLDNDSNSDDHHQAATTQDLRHTMESLQPMLCRWRQVFDEFELEAL